MRGGARALVGATICFVLFVCGYYLFGGEASSRGGGPAMKTPGDWLNGVHIAVAALQASAIATLVYRRPNSRPMAIGIALGLLLLNVPVQGILEEVSDLVRIPQFPTKQAIARMPHFVQSDWVQLILSASVLRARMYWAYYLTYILWSVVALYSGYLGQYLVGFLLFKSQARKESAVYLAENAGMGLVASITAGVVAMALAAGLTEVAMPGVHKAALLPPASAAPVAAVSPGPAAPPPGGVSGRVGEFLGDVLAPAAGYASSGRLRTQLLVTVLCFSVTAYIAALSFRPRTSTWVAVGAIVGVMLLPLAAVKLVVGPLRGAPFFGILEVSPFMLAGTAVASALGGDWLARLLMAHAAGRKKDVYRPL